MILPCHEKAQVVCSYNIFCVPEMNGSQQSEANHSNTDCSNWKANYSKNKKEGIEEGNKFVLS